MTRCICLGIMLIFAVLLPLTTLGEAEEKPAVVTDVTVVLKQALKEKRVVVFAYKGYARTVEPHALGKGTEGKAVLLAWQTAGGSQTEPPPGWRVFLVTEIKELKSTEVTFVKPRPDYGSHKTGRGLKSVDAEIAME